MIDPLARVHPHARLAADVAVGPWTVIGPQVEIGAGTRIDAHVVIDGPTRIGRDNRIHSFCSIGADPQDKKFRADSRSRLEIGDRNTLREYCSINRGTPGGGGVTQLGDDNWIMAYVHIAHDCQVGSRTVFANNATLAGHVVIEDFVSLGGFTGVHQFCRIGAYSFTAIAAIVVKDVPPFLLVAGNSARACGLNRVGLKRNGFDADALRDLKRAYRLLYRDGLQRAQAMVELDRMAAASPHVRRWVDFIRASARGIVGASRQDAARAHGEDDQAGG
ncbi:MAG: acyl-ACP--UDP-N-acetylglucosamine O-acyltransferase [Gammaproteobacteria bacterium]